MKAILAGLVAAQVASGDYSIVELMWYLTVMVVLLTLIYEFIEVAYARPEEHDAEEKEQYQIAS